MKKQKVNNHKWTAIDLFSGCGGLTQGLLDAGFTVVSAVEIDILAVETYKINHPSIPLLNSDIRSINGKILIEKSGVPFGQLDLLTACPPCQGFSRLRNNNKYKRMLDPRNRLIDDVLRLTLELKESVKNFE